jgi:hypothetical protein
MCPSASLKIPHLLHRGKKQFIVAKVLYKRSKNVSHLNPAIAPMKQKKPRFCIIVAKNGSKQNIMDLAGDLAGDAGAIFLY